MDWFETSYDRKQEEILRKNWDKLQKEKVNINNKDKELKQEK
jgi:hypothetical protein